MNPNVNDKEAQIRIQKKIDNRKGFIYAFSFFTFLVLVLFIIYSSNHKINNEKLTLSQFQELNHIETLIHDYIGDSVNVLLLFNNSIYTRELLKADDDLKWDIFSDIFLSMIKGTDIYNQIRLIDTNGNEIVRVDRQVTGEYEIIPKEKLQYKGDRYYFKETMESTESKLYISPFDLNVEHGKIEIPHKPMIRIGKVIKDYDGTDLGMMIVNIMGQTLLADSEHLNIHKGDILYLLNEDGHYLYNTDLSKTFSFMFPEKDEIGFNIEHPEIWSGILDNNTIIKNENGHFYVKKIQLIDEEIYSANNRYFYLVMQVHKEDVFRADKTLINSLFFVFAVVSPFLFLTGWLLGTRISKNRWYQNKLEEHASVDSLTGLYNHRMIMKLLEQNISLAKRRKEPLTIIFADINSLKFVNDTYGHEVGDKMILSAAESLSSAVRFTDMVARLGGDEFLIILPNCNNNDSTLIMERATNTFMKSGIEEINMAWIISYGCATLEENESITELVNRADKLMYDYKIKIKAENKL